MDRLSIANSGNRLARLFLMILASFMVMACSQTPTNNSSGIIDSEGGLSTPLPASISALYNCSDLSAELVVDGSTIVPLTINADCTAVSGTIAELTAGPHTFIINYYLPDANGVRLLIASTGETTVEIVAGEDIPINFDSSSLTFPDNDEDGISNLDELDGGTDPQTSAPGQPQDVSITPGNTTLQVEWTVEVDRSYNIYLSTSSGVNKNNSELKLTEVTSPSSIPDLINGTKYFIVVTAVNSGGESLESTEVTATPLPDPPQNVSAEPGDSAITVQWDLIPGLTYNISYSTTSPVTKTNFESNMGGVTSPHTITGLANGTLYFIVVTAVENSGESNESVEVSATPNAVSKFAYVVNSGDNTLSSYIVDFPTGALRHNGYVTTDTNPNFVTVDPLDRFVFVANLSDSISAYTINSNNGSLTEVVGSPFDHRIGVPGTLATSAVVDPTGNFLFVTDGRGPAVSSVTSFRIDQTSGALTEVDSKPAGDQPQGITVHPTQNFIYAANYLDNNIFGYSFDSSTGNLTPLSSPFGDGGTSGFNPYSITIHPNGNFAYIANEGSQSLSRWSIDSSTGDLGFLGQTDSIGTETETRSIAIDAEGVFAFAANGDDFSPNGTVAVFSINSNTGDLIEVAGSPFAAGKAPMSVTVDQSGEFIYTTNSGTNDVSIFDLDRSTGSLSLTNTVSSRDMPLSIALTDGVTPVTITPQFAYVANQSSNNISAYTIDSSNGELAIIETEAAGTAPQDIAIDPTNRFAFVANEGNPPEIKSFTIDPLSGALDPLETLPDQRPLGITIDPSGRFAYVLNGAVSPIAANIQTYEIDPDTGLLDPIDVDSTPLSPGKFEIEPSGRFAYVFGFPNNDIRGYSINPVSGALTAISPDFSGVDPIALTMHPNGRFAYFSHSDGGEIDLYTIDPLKGALTVVPGSSIPGGSSPSSLAIDPLGRFLYVGDFNSGAVAVFSIDPVTALLTKVEDEPAGTDPASVTVDPSGQYVYVANSGTQNVSVFSIDQSTGELDFIENEIAGQVPVSITTTGMIK